MSESREKVLTRVRRALGRGSLDERTCSQLAARISSPPTLTRIDFTEDAVERFVIKARGEAATVARIADDQEIPDAVAQYLKSHNLAAKFVAAPALRSIDWPQHLDIDFGTTRGEHESGVTPCLAAVAETGSVVLLSGVQTPTSLNLLPDNHIVIVRHSQVLRNFEDVWRQLRERDAALPRAVNFVTGPSRTGDIEQTIQLGAHGPRRVHIILVDDTEA
ncbi:MAG: LUD domain-containing protein [Gammaproteobacteria bacterium]|nr:LUD domain-containing protein [Gammaproteobacteria bacterium]